MRRRRNATPRTPTTESFARDPCARGRLDPDRKTKSETYRPPRPAGRGCRLRSDLALSTLTCQLPMAAAPCRRSRFLWFRHAPIRGTLTRLPRTRRRVREHRPAPARVGHSRFGCLPHDPGGTNGEAGPRHQRCTHGASGNSGGLERTGYGTSGARPPSHATGE